MLNLKFEICKLVSDALTGMERKEYGFENQIK